MKTTDPTFVHELAKMLGIQPCTVYTAMFRARNRLAPKRATVAPKIQSEFEQLKVTQGAELRETVAAKFFAGDSGLAAVIVGEAFDVAEQRLGNRDHQIAMLPWLRTIVINRVLDYRRAKCA